MKFNLLFILPFAATLISANPIEEDVAIVPNEDEKEILSPVIEDSKAEELPAQGRLFFVQAYATSYVTTATSTLSTYTSCYSTLNAAPVCSSSVLSGKRKRQAEFLNETPRLLMDNGETTDFRDYIKASRRAMEDRGPRLITVTTTITSSTAATITQTQAAKQTLKFTSVNDGDCFPMSLINSLAIPAC